MTVPASISASRVSPVGVLREAGPSPSGTTPRTSSPACSATSSHRSGPKTSPRCGSNSLADQSVGPTSTFRQGDISDKTTVMRRARQGSVRRHLGAGRRVHGPASAGRFGPVHRAACAGAPTFMHPDRQPGRFHSAAAPGPIRGSGGRSRARADSGMNGFCFRASTRAPSGRASPFGETCR